MKPSITERAPQARRRRAGITLIELLVAIAGFVTIGAIVLQIYDETQKASQKMVRRQAGVDYAVAFLDQTADLLRQAVHPGDLDVPIGTVFLADRFSVPVYGDPASNGLFLLSLRPKEDASDGHRFETVREVWAAADNTTRGTATQTPFGAAFEEAEPKVSFRYATEAKPGAPAYRDQLEATEWPALVEITIEIPGVEGEDPVLMQTAVIPGWLGPLQPFVPTPTPTPLPAAPLATQEAVPAEAAPAPAAAAAPAAAPARPRGRAARQRRPAAPPAAAPAPAPAPETAQPAAPAAPAQPAATETQL